MRRWGVLLLVFACGDNLPGGPIGGTRLALHTYVYDDGTVQLVPGSYRDLTRDEDCAPIRWGDGARYCTPAAGEIVSLDDGCHTDAARLTAAAPEAYAAARRSDGLVTRLARAGEPLTGGAPVRYWRLAGGACDGPFDEDGAHAYAQLLDDVDRGELVRFARTAPQGDGRLQLVYDQTGDGLSVPAAFHDRTLGLDCAPRARPDAADTPCAPTSAAVASYFADAACRTPVAEVDSFPPPDAIEATIDGCTSDFATGGPVASEPLWFAQGCIETAAPDGTYAEAGSQLALARVSRQPRSGARIQPIALGGTALTAAYVHDATLGVDCTPQLRPSDGLLHCMPATLAPTTLERFLDPTCGIRVDVLYLPETSCDPPASYTIGPQGYWRHVGGPESRTLYEAEPGGCAVAPAPDGTQPHILGALLPDGMFATARLR